MLKVRQMKKKYENKIKMKVEKWSLWIKGKCISDRQSHIIHEMHVECFSGRKYEINSKRKNVDDVKDVIISYRVVKTNSWSRIEETIMP